MAVSETSLAPHASPVGAIVTQVYRAVAYFGLVSVMGALIFGFRYDASAPWRNYVFDVLLYAAFIAPHLLFTRAWWKQRVWGQPAGSLRERQFYILFTVVTWLGMLLLQWPLPGFAFDVPAPIRFAGTVAFLLATLLFFEKATRESLDGLLGVPGAAMQFSHGSETPLYTEGPYAQVRHPMYRAAILMGIASLFVHPHMAQFLWTMLVGATFIGFIPVEEAQLLAARGDDYVRYREQTPYRLFRGVW